MARSWGEPNTSKSAAKRGWTFGIASIRVASRRAPPAPCCDSRALVDGFEVEEYGSWGRRNMGLLGPICKPTCQTWPHLGLSLRPSWGQVGPSWPQVEPMLRRCWLETAKIWRIFWRYEKWWNYMKLLQSHALWRPGTSDNTPSPAQYAPAIALTGWSGH